MCANRQIKCNRLRPSCEACKVFQCACIYGTNQPKFQQRRLILVWANDELQTLFRKSEARKQMCWRRC